MPLSKIKFQISKIKVSKLKKIFPLQRKMKQDLIHLLKNKLHKGYKLVFAPCHDENGYFLELYKYINLKTT